jgi:hypothetical protein
MAGNMGIQTWVAGHAAMVAWEIAGIRLAVVCAGSQNHAAILAVR